MRIAKAERCTMRALVFLFILIVSAFGEVDFYSKTRNFSVELLYHAVQHSNQDVIISPYVIWYLLISLAYDTLGVTREQFFKVFSLTEDRTELVRDLFEQRTSVLQNKNVSIKFLNSVGYDEKLNVPSETLRRFKVDFRFVAFSLKLPEPQHDWFSSDKPTMIMSNHFSFEAEWSKPFNVSATVEGYLRDGSAETEFDVMYLKARLRFSDLESLHASVTELPYRGNTHCMLLLRPHRGHDVRQVLRNLRDISLKDVFAKLQSDVDEFGLREVEVKLPRIDTVNLGVNLNKALVNMGLSDMFKEHSTHFNSFDEDNIFIGEISQSMTLRMTESGTKLTSSTPAATIENERPVERIEVDLQDPFIFFIMETTTATMLSGGIYSKIVDYVLKV